jgi:hypothetical protein
MRVAQRLLWLAPLIRITIQPAILILILLS